VKVNVSIPGNLRRYCAEQEHLEAEGSTIGEALADLAERFPQLGERVMDEQGRLRSHLVVIRADEILSRNGLHELPLQDGETLRIFVAASGG
jgi:molybdopterin converting factor small subunit